MGFGIRVASNCYMDITRDELMARLKLILERDGSEGNAELLRAVETQIPNPNAPEVESYEAESIEQQQAEMESEMQAELAYERYLENRNERYDEYEPPDTDIFDGMDGE